MKALAVILVLIFATWGGSAGAEDAHGRILGDAKDANACLNCHDAGNVPSILHSAHGVKGDIRTGMSAEGCQSCHGDSTAHMAKPADGQPRTPPSIVFSGLHASPVTVRNKTCISCHEGGLRMHWQGSQHESSDIACTNCHTSHTVADPVVSKRTQAPVCFACHAEQRAANLKPSHHPVIEGLVACSDCHNPHGSTTRAMLKGATVNDTCYTCHDEKRGPFLWEHAPVQEDCTICHTPHGSIQASLLKQRPPYLCQDCHDSTLHESQPLSGANIPSGTQPSRVMVLRACLNCHTEVHGSNHPSGPRLER